MKRQRRNRVRIQKKWKKKRSVLWCKRSDSYGRRRKERKREEYGEIEKHARERKTEKVKQKKGKDGEYVQDENGAESSVEERQKWQKEIVDTCK